MVRLIGWAGNMTLSNAFLQGVLTSYEVAVGKPEEKVYASSTRSHGVQYESWPSWQAQQQRYFRSTVPELRPVLLPQSSHTLCW